MRLGAIGIWWYINSQKEKVWPEIKLWSTSTFRGLICKKQLAKKIGMEHRDRGEKPKHVSLNDDNDDDDDDDGDDD